MSAFESHFIALLKNGLKIRGMKDQLGDDCGGFLYENTHLSQQTPILVSTDMLVEGVHFPQGCSDAYSIGKKLVSVNLSDMAAGMAIPLGMTISVAIPHDFGEARIKLLIDGILDQLKKYQVDLLGGDTNRSLSGLVVSGTVFGSSRSRQMIGRSGLAAGDLIFVTGSLGGSFRSGRHMEFEPRLHESLWLYDHLSISAIQDLSDGLASDAKKMAQRSFVDIVIEFNQVPVHPDAKALYDDDNDALKAAFVDGEDFELLVGVRQMPHLHDVVASSPFPLTQIGRVIAGNGRLLLVDGSGQPRECEWTGFEH